MDPKILDAYVGKYDFAPDSTRLSIWREGDQQMAQIWENNITQGAVEIYPEARQKFFDKLIGVQLEFATNDQGDVSGVVVRSAGGTEHRGIKLRVEKTGAEKTRQL